MKVKLRMYLGQGHHIIHAKHADLNKVEIMETWFQLPF